MATKEDTKRSALEAHVIELSKDPVLQDMLDRERVESEELDSRLLLKLMAYVKRHRALGIASVVLSIVQSLLMTLPPYAIGLAIDVVRSGPHRELNALGRALSELALLASALAPQTWGAQGALVIGFGAVIVLCWSARLGVAVASTYMVQMLGQRAVHDLRMDVYQHISAMDMGFFHKNPVGRLVNRTTFDTQALSQFFSDAFAQGMRDILFLLVLLVVMFSMDVPLALIILLVFPLLIGCGYLYRWLVRPPMRTTKAVISRMNSWWAENISGMRENQLYGTQDRRQAEFGTLTESHQRSVTDWIRAWGLLRPMMMVTCAVATAAVLWMGYGRVVSGAITIGILLTFIQFTTELWRPVRNLTEKFTVIQTALTATERIFDVLQTPSQMTDAPQAQKGLAVEQGRIEFEDVTFSYPGLDDVVLDHVSFEAKPGQLIALVGDTGAGKSTIAHLISRFYDASSGRVLVDGKDVRDYRLRALRAGMALVPQDVVIFAGTIRENITLGLEVSDEVILEAIDAVRAQRLVDRFEDGLDHVMDESGRTLSAGERQLLSFARALVFNAPVLILDEATANVDTETEALIQDALERLTKGRTSVVVAHRLSTIRHADQILVLRHGKIIERGRHEELLALDQEYARLHELHMSEQ